jgi:sugar O-acyltransferase (sialic acid O-acetyltransferase NeuD family)
MSFCKVMVPKDTVSDETYRLLTLLHAEGAPVRKGEAICEMETSKTVIEIASPADGHIFFGWPLHADVPVGALLAVIGDGAKRPADAFPSPVPAKAPESAASGKRISKSALALMAQHGLTADDFAELAVVGSAEVLSRVDGSASDAAEARPPVMLSADLPNIAMLGGGGHAKMCIDLIRSTGRWNIVGILDSIQPIGSTVLGVPVIGRDGADDLARVRAAGVQDIVNGVGLIERHLDRAVLNARLRAAGFRLPNMIHARAVVEPSAVLGDGNQVMAGAIVGSAARIGNGCIINSGAVVSHDARIDDDTHIAPGALLAGSVTVGERSLIGMGVTIYYRVTIGKEVIVANGCNVLADLHDATVVRHQHRD